MNDTVWEPRTVSGHKLDEAVSALQKEIRRGKEVEAVYWAQELEFKYWKYLWTRLLVICHEDIGIASPSTTMYVEVCRQHYKEMRDSGHWENLPLINAVVAMCRSKKTRLSISLHLKVYEDADLKLEPPDYALDMHTERGRKMGRGIDHFHEEGVQLYPKADNVDQYEEVIIPTLGKKSKPRAWMKELTSQLRNKKGKKDNDEAEQGAFSF